jgi:hypothetical protein
MSSAKPGTISSAPNYQPIGQDVMVGDTALHILLIDGRLLEVPLAHWSFLMQATPQQRHHWQFEPGNEIIYWPDLDDGLAIAHLLGLPED